jgi:hypothetical protein
MFYNIGNMFILIGNIYIYKYMFIDIKHLLLLLFHCIIIFPAFSHEVSAFQPIVHPWHGTGSNLAVFK